MLKLQHHLNNIVETTRLTDARIIQLSL